MAHASRRLHINERDETARPIMEGANLLTFTQKKRSYRAAKTEAEMTAKGRKVIRTIIDSPEFPLWCRARGQNVDAKGWNAATNSQITHRVKI